MTKNIGSFDRIARLVLGLLLLGFAIYSKSAILAIFGIFTLFEAVSSWCIFYQLIGRNTCPIKNKKENKVPFISIFITGIAILFVAIILNILATFFGLLSWYELLMNFDKNIGNLSLDDILFLTIIYPFSLGYTGYFVNKLLNK